MAVYNVPAHNTSFLGRESELDDLASLLPRCRLLTLVGLGGIGKSRLAVELACRVDDAFPDGVYFVPLQPLTAPDQMVLTILSTLGVNAGDDPGGSLVRYLADMNVLLILDNFEHLMAGSDLIAHILDHTTNTKILVTSRESLRLSAEWVRRVRGLGYVTSPPSPLSNLERGSNRDEKPLSQGQTHPAPALFIDRAERLRGNVDFAAQMDEVVNICRLCDGLPLALELAAGWVQTLTLDEIADEIQAGLDILSARVCDAPERHRSMQAVFDQTWVLMTDHERSVVRRCTVFRGGFDRLAGKHVAGASLTDLASLVEKSLLRHDPESGRYDMQELLRQYAEERLVESGESDAVRDRHAEYYVDKVYHFSEAFSQIDMAQYIALMRSEIANVRTAWYYGLDYGKHTVVDRLLKTFWYYSLEIGTWDEHIVLCRAAEDKLRRNASDPVLLGRVLVHLGTGYLSVGEYKVTEQISREGLEIVRDAQILFETARALTNIACSMCRTGRHEQARVVMAEAIQYGREKSVLFPADLCRYAIMLFHNGALDQSRHLVDEALEMSEREFEPGLVHTHHYKGILSLWTGYWQDAHRHFAQSWQGFSSRGSRKLALGPHSGLGCVAVATGDLDYTRQVIATIDDAKRNNVTSPEILRRADCLAVYLAVADGNYADARQRAVTSLRDARRSGDELLVMAKQQHLGMVLVGLGEFDEAVSLLLESLERMVFWQATGYAMYGIGTFAFVYAHDGELTRAVELLGLALTHPNSPCGYFEKHVGIAQLRDDLQAEMGADAYTAAWERGSKRDPLDTGRAILRDFGVHASKPVHAANQALPDPLTERELEVLRLIADGLSNNGIAAKLVITRGTVRTHINKAYHKLNVGNRVAAINRARELRLI